MMRRSIYSLFVIALGLFLFSESSYALPRFALYSGSADCSGCHVNPTGGGIRTAGGEGFSKSVLPMWKRGEKFNAELTDGIRIGADFRIQSLNFSDDVTFGSNTEGAKLGTDTSFTYGGGQVMSTALYLDASLTDAIQAYTRYDMAAGHAGYNDFEFFGLINFVHSSGEFLASGDVVNNAYLKVGSFLPAFGLRLDDHTAFTRGGNAGLSRFGSAGFFWVPNYRDIGVEVGATFFDKLFLTLGRYNGLEQNWLTTANERNNEPAYTARLVASSQIVPDLISLELGGSIYAHARDVINDSGVSAADNISVIGIHGGLRVWQVSVLAELDMGKNVPVPRSGIFVDESQAMLVEATVGITKGLTGLVRFDTYEDKIGDAIRMKVKDRIAIGAQWFPVRFLEVRPEVRFANSEYPNEEDATVRDTHKETTALVQFHFFF